MIIPAQAAAVGHRPSLMSHDAVVLNISGAVKLGSLANSVMTSTS